MSSTDIREWQTASWASARRVPSRRSLPIGTSVELSTLSTSENAFASQSEELMPIEHRGSIVENIPRNTSLVQLLATQFAMGG